MTRRILYTLAALALFGNFYTLHAQREVSILQQIINQVNSDSLMQFVKELSGVVPVNIAGQPYTITSRHKNQPGNDKAAEYIKQKLESYGMQANLQTFSSTGKNPIAIQRGTVFPNQKYMICAHMDCMPSGSSAPGADDNGSGTAAVLEAARILKNYTFPFSIIYALWDEEEQGLVGSAYYANATTPADSILGVVNMDMISWERNNDNKVNIHTRAVGSSLDISAKMVELNAAYSIGLMTNLKNPGITASDHASFWNKNIGAVLLIEDDDNDFNAYYHTVNDKYTEFNVPYFKKCAQLAIATVASFALNLNIQIAHTPHPSVSFSDKVTVYASVLSGLEVGSGSLAPRLYYRTNYGNGYGAYSAEPGVLVSPGFYQFALPKIPFGSAVQYYIAAQDAQGQIIVTSPKGGGGMNPPGSTPPPALHQFFIAPQSILLSEPATSLAGWTGTGAPWGTTSSKFVSPPSSFTESPSGTYASSLTASLTYNAPISLSASLGAALEFDIQYELEDKYDYMQVQVSTDNGTTWTPLAGQYTKTGSGSFQPTGQPLYNGTQLTWVHDKMDLSPFYGKTLRLRFYFRTDGSVNKDGFFVDNISIFSYAPVAYECYLYDVKAADGKTIIRWSSNGNDATRYYLERSGEHENWIQLSELPGQQSREVFQYTDNEPLPGKNRYRIKTVSVDGTVTYSVVQTLIVEPPAAFALEQNFPNPFNPSTTIHYTVGGTGAQSGTSRVKLTVYDALGKQVAVLVDEDITCGSHQVRFNAAALPSGTYFYELRSGEYRTIKRMSFIK